MVKGPNQGAANLLAEFGAKYKTAQIKIYILAFGSLVNMGELEQITLKERIFQVSTYADVVEGVNLKVGGISKQESLFLILQRRIGKCEYVRVTFLFMLENILSIAVA